MLVRPATHASGQTGPEVPEMTSLDDAVEAFMAKWSVPGGAFAVTYQGRLVYARGFGYADVENQIPVEPTSTFRIASVSKSITGIAVAKLIDDGVLTKADKVFGPGGILTGARYDSLFDARIADITVGDLLHHTSGFATLSSGRDPVFADLEAETAMNFGLPHSPEDKIEYYLKTQTMNRNPGVSYLYSNLGYLVLGRVIEAVTGMSYAAYCDTALFAPLGISTIKIGYSLPENRLPHEVKYYEYAGAATTTSVYGTGEQVPWTYGGMNVETFDAHGGWTASVIDLVKLLGAADGFTTAADILSSSAVATMSTALPYSSGYAMGFAVNGANNWWHTGSIPGASAEWVRASGGYNFALLFNYRPANHLNNQFNGEMDGLFWGALSGFTGWPSHDLYSTFTGVEPSRGAAATTLSLSVYPNPARNDVVSLDILSDTPGNVTVTVYDLLGRVVSEPERPIGSRHVLEIGDLHAGTYFIRAQSGTAVATQQLFVVRGM